MENKELEKRNKRIDLIAKEERDNEKRIELQLKKMGVKYKRRKIRTNGFGNKIFYK